MPSLLVTGLTRSSAHCSLLENNLTAKAIETEEISTLSSHKLNQGRHESLLHDLGTHCYLQGRREGKGRTQRERRRESFACKTEESFTFIYLLLCTCDIAVVQGRCVCLCVCVREGGILCVWGVLCESSPSC